MRTELYNHNRMAYKRVMAAFEKENRTCVCHPTGTGKSYVVAAVSETASRVLVLAPNDFVLHQQQLAMRWHTGAEYRTYQWLHQHPEVANRRYDLIVLDEFHRVGAPEWQADVEALMDSQPQTRVLGTTATPIRQLDGGRNMVDELFGGNVASEMTIAEAWTKYSVLPIPRYVSGLFRLDKVAEDAKERISRSRTLSDGEKRKRVFRLSNKIVDWQLSYGMPAILRRHLDNDARRVIVFLAHIEQLEPMRDEVAGWFREAGFTVAGTYMLHSDMTDAKCRRQMGAFEADGDTGVKLMFAVNMLNEGIHVPDVNAVLMLRTTSSNIVYMQQMGRCLTAANTTKPLVLDMVDNITTTTAIRGIADEFDRLEKVQAEQEEREPRRFEVIDYTLGVKDMIERLVPQDVCLYDAEQRLAIIVPWCDEHGRLPNDRTEREVGKHWKWLAKHAPEHPEVQRLRSEYSKFASVEVQIKPIEDFYDRHHRYPKRKFGKDEERMEAVWKRLRRRYAGHPAVKTLVGREQQRRRQESEAQLEQLLAVCRETKARGQRIGDLPEYKRLLWHYADRPEVAALRNDCVEKIGERKTLDERLSEIQEICRRTGYLPRRSEGESLYVTWSHIKNEHADDERVKRILAEYPAYDTNAEKRKKHLEMLREFIESNQRLPLPADSCYLAWVKFRKKYRDQVVHWIEKYGKGYRENVALVQHAQ